MNADVKTLSPANESLRSRALNSVEEIIADFKAGKMVVIGLDDVMGALDQVAGFTGQARFNAQTPRDHTTARPGRREKVPVVRAHS